jgi:predicted transposase YbfD/YdcC
VKGNQKELLDDCRVMAANDVPVDAFTAEPESGHGRVEQRSVRVFECHYTSDPEWTQWIVQVAQVHRVREVKDTKTGTWKRSEEIAFYASMQRHSAQAYERIIRSHWGIENRNHGVRDVSLKEDASRIRHNPGVMARCRSFVLNVLKANGVTNVAQTLYHNALCFKNLRKLKYLCL